MSDNVSRERVMAIVERVLDRYLARRLVNDLMRIINNCIDDECKRESR